MLKQFRYFLCIAEQKSFSKAAAKLYLSTPALTQQINALEEEIQCQLFVRTNRGITLTPAGQYFYEEIAKVIQKVDQTVQRTQEIASSEQKTLRIGQFREILGQRTSELLSAFCQSRPDVHIETVNLQQLPTLQTMRNDVIDLIDLGESAALHDMGFSFFCVGDSLPCCDFSRNHKDLSSKSHLQLEDLKHKQISILTPGIVNGNDLIRRHLQEQAPDICVHDTDLSPQSVPNALLRGNIVISWENCSNVASGCMSLPLHCGIRAKYGLYYSPESSRPLLWEFLEFAKRYSLN